VLHSNVQLKKFSTSAFAAFRKARDAKKGGISNTELVRDSLFYNEIQ
jgi:hypothetical protein